MAEEYVTVRDLFDTLLDIVVHGDGDNKVRVSVSYDKCDHIQDMKKVQWDDEWITLAGDSE